MSIFLTEDVSRLLILSMYLIPNCLVEMSSKLIVLLKPINRFKNVLCLFRECRSVYSSSVAKGDFIVFSIGCSSRKVNLVVENFFIRSRNKQIKKTPIKIIMLINIVKIKLLEIDEGYSQVR